MESEEPARGGLKQLADLKLCGADGTRNSTETQNPAVLGSNEHSEETSPLGVNEPKCVKLGNVPESPDQECRKRFDSADVEESDRVDVSKEPADPVEAALAEAIALAAKSQQWGTVETLSRELSARRLARTSPDVATLEGRRKVKEGS